MPAQAAAVCSPVRPCPRRAAGQHGTRGWARNGGDAALGCCSTAAVAQTPTPARGL